MEIEIYSTVDACKTANEMWIAIERLQQGESLNVQDVKTNLFWEFGKFTSRDGESMESPSASTRHKGKEIAKPVTPQSESVSEEDSDPEQAQRDKDMQKKNLALLGKYFQKLYKPNNNTFRYSSNSMNKTEDTTPRHSAEQLVKKSLLTKSQLEGYLKENTKVISDLKVKEDKDIDKMIEMDKQLKFLNEIVYTRNQSIQTIHMLAPKCSTYNGRPTFANPRYLKKAQSEKPCLYEIPYDTSDPANRFAPDREETMTLDNRGYKKIKIEYRYVKPYDYTNQNSPL
ncbi:hypothetical protein Tco_0480389 [Tanacetum coccineum]